MADLGQIYAIHPSGGVTSAQIAAAYNLEEDDYIVVSDDANPPAGFRWDKYINLYPREDGRYYSKEVLWGDNGDESTPLYDGREVKRGYERRAKAGEIDNPINTAGPDVGVF